MGSMRHMYRRGSTSHTLFARGYGDGTLCVWDYRNKTVRLSPHVSHMAALATVLTPVSTRTCCFNLVREKTLSFMRS